MRFEFDQIIRVITSEDYDRPIIFKCNSSYQYRGLCERLLSPSQIDKHIALSMDGIYNVSEKRLLDGIQYMKNNEFNPRQ